MVQTAVAAYFQFGPDAECASLVLGLADTLLDAAEVAFKIERPLVERACRNCSGVSG